MFELTMLGRIALAIVLCAVIGVEREFHGRPAGLRTHLLVGGGAALVMVIGVTFIYRVMADPVGATSFDIGRLIAGVVTGIGFLGAGTIIRQGDWVLGLTTAASVWFVAGIGIAAGLGLYILASGATVVGFLVLFGISRLEAWMPNLVRRTLVLELPQKAGTSVRKDIQRFCAQRHVRARLLSWETDEETGITRTKLLLTYWRAVDIVSLAKEIREMTGAINVEVKN
jgi:putative Mg2+ transporter-C (MgtC) family protein